MYGDTEVMRRRADQLREQGVDVRAMADQLVAQTEAVGWTGRAASSMRERIAERAAHLREAATDHENAAEALLKHVTDVEAHQEQIAATERRASSLVADAATRVKAIEAQNEAALADGTGTRVEPDPNDVVLASFDPPAAGSKDWLTVELPGL